MVRLVSGIKNMGFLHKMEYNWDSNNFSIHIYIYTSVKYRWNTINP